MAGQPLRDQKAVGSLGFERPTSLQGRVTFPEQGTLSDQQRWGLAQYFHLQVDRGVPCGGQCRVGADIVDAAGGYASTPT